MTHTTVEVDILDILDITKIWRGARGTGDMMARQGALRLTAQGMTVDLVGTSKDFDGLLAEITRALTDAAW